MTIECRNCKALNPDQARFCNDCGTQLATPDIECLSCHAPNPSGSAFCNKCGQQLVTEQAASSVLIKEPVESASSRSVDPESISPASPTGAGWQPISDASAINPSEGSQSLPDTAKTPTASSEPPVAGEGWSPGAARERQEKPTSASPPAPAGSSLGARVAASMAILILGVLTVGLLIELSGPYVEVNFELWLVILLGFSLLIWAWWPGMRSLVNKVAIALLLYIATANFVALTAGILGDQPPSLVLLAGSLIGIAWLWRRPSLRPRFARKSRSKARAGKLRGEVRGFQQRSERLKPHFAAVEYNDIIIWTFRLERYDAGERLPPIPLEMRGKSFSGFINEGDTVEIKGKWRPGTVFKTKRVYNVTSDSAVKVKK